MIALCQEMREALVPVSEALLSLAQRRAEDVGARGDEYARERLSEARLEARRVLEEARREGAEVAERIAASRLAAARRAAHQTVLAARRRAFDELRRRALSAVVDSGATPEGTILTHRLSTVVGRRLGAFVQQPGTPTAAFVVEASSGKRRCRVGPEELVDHALSGMADEVEALWR
jgi:hypothetical protein